MWYKEVNTHICTAPMFASLRMVDTILSNPNDRLQCSATSGTVGTTEWGLGNGHSGPSGATTGLHAAGGGGALRLAVAGAVRWGKTWTPRCGRPTVLPW